MPTWHYLRADHLFAIGLLISSFSLRCGLAGVFLYNLFVCRKMKCLFILYIAGSVLFCCLKHMLIGDG